MLIPKQIKEHLIKKQEKYVGQDCFRSEVSSHMGFSSFSGLTSSGKNRKGSENSGKVFRNAREMFG